MEQFEITTHDFEGPLDTLLDLIEDRKLSISQVSMAEVTDAYLAYIEKLPELPLGETAQFILIASTLLLIKSRTLLPTLDLTDEERESVEELERRLARYAIFRKGAKGLRKQWGIAPLMLPRRAPAAIPVFTPAEASTSLLAEAARRLVNLLPKPAAMAAAAVAPIIRLEDVIVSLKQRLTTAFRARFRELTKSRERHEVIVYFLAILELVRSGSASVTQERLFEDITIEAEHLATPKFGKA